MFIANNPDKTFSAGGTTISQRLDMMNLMATQIKKELMVPTSIHITPHGLVFNQAQELRMKYSNSEFYFIMGNDTFSRFKNEKYYANYDFKQELTRLFQSSHLVNFPRKASDTEDTNDSLLTCHALSPFTERINTMEFSNAISSSQIRHAIQAGGDVSKLLLPSIMEYISSIQRASDDTGLSLKKLYDNQAA
jgi:nicotinic acid mononucleotide adenylyltransferase